MTKHSSATARDDAPHVLETSRTNTIINALKRRAQAVLNDTSIDAQSRAIIRYGLETNDPWLAELVRRADEGEAIVDTVDFSQAPPVTSDHASCGHDLPQKRIEALTEMICRPGDEPETKSAALGLLMATLEDSTHPKALANTAKHFALTRCGELNLQGVVDAQIAVIEDRLFAN